LGYCPRCGAEYRAGFTECSDCGVALVDAPPPVVKKPSRDPLPFDPSEVARLVPVYVADRFQGDIVRSVLEGSGIPAIVMKEGYAEAYPINVGAIGEGRVLVREEDLERAHEVLTTALGGDAGLEQDEDEEPYERPLWFWVATTIICIVAVVALLSGVLPVGP
jgi:hypothetical protein